MANLERKKSPTEKIAKTEPVLALGTWVVDQIQRNWPSLTALAVWSGGMTWLGWFTDIVKLYAPLSYGVVFGLSAIAFALFYALFAWGGARASDRRLKDALTAIPHGTNPLRDMFENEVIHLSDFEMPDHMIFKGKTFSRCRIIGPQTVFVSGGGGFSHCGGNVFFLKLSEDDQKIDGTNIMVFQDTTFRNCTFYRVTFIGMPDFIDRMIAGNDG